VHGDGNSLGTGVTGFTQSGSQFGVYGLSLATSGSAIAVQGTSTVGIGVAGTTASPTLYAVYGQNTGTSGKAIGVYGTSVSTTGYGVSGYDSATSGATAGVYGVSASTSGAGVWGFNNATSGNAVGVYGNSASTSGAGVWGFNNATSGNAVGVYGNSASTSGWSVEGNSTAASGVTVGVLGYSYSPTGYGMYGQNNATTGNAYGVGGESLSTTGVGVIGTVLATTGRNYGVYGSSASPQGIGVHGDGNLSGGVGVSGTTSGITQYGVYGQNIGTTGPAYGVYGETFSYQGYGITGINMATSGIGGGAGVYGNSLNPGGVGVMANATAGGTALVAAANPGGYAAQLTGNVYMIGNLGIQGDLQVSGSIAKGSGSFKIDHPLDPANKYLSHSFVESPDMMNVYNGNVTTDNQGTATVILPDYFEALNGEFRYQLTVIGQFAQAMVSQKIANNRFVIRTDKPSVEVSWQVTGIRHDAYAQAHRIPVEEEKPAAEQGYYLHPDAFGQPESKSIQAARARRPRSNEMASRGTDPSQALLDGRTAHAAAPLQNLFRGAGVGQRQLERAARAAADQSAAAGRGDPGDSAAAASGEYNVQLGRMAGRGALLAVKARMQRTIADQRNTVIGGSAQPCLHRWGDVDEDVLVFVRRGERDGGGNGGSQGWGVAGVDPPLRPRAVDVDHIKAARRAHRIHIDLQRGLGNVGAGVTGGDRREVELNVSRLRGALDVEHRLGAVVRGGRRGVSVRIGAGRKLAVCRRTRQQNQRQK
jgi:hypothetical protein